MKASFFDFGTWWWLAISDFGFGAWGFFFLVLPLVTSTLAAGSPELTELKSYPGEIILSTANARQRIVVQATYADGITRDVTSQAGYALADPQLARVDPEAARTNRSSASRTNRLSSKWDNGQFRRSEPPRPRTVPAGAKKGNSAEASVVSTTVASATNQVALSPLADGHTELRVSYEGRTLTVPVTVSNATAHPSISFKLDVMPVFMKAGCNAGSCHGSSRGKDGFHLSLYGFDPDGDYHRLTREQIGRRINLAIPEESLIVQKGLGAVTHTGGVRFGTNSDLCQTLIAWLAAGAPKDPPEIPKLTGIEIFPNSAVLEGSNTVQRLVVRARYSDGAVRDVTPLTMFISNNDVTAKVAEDGVITAGQRGEAFIQARFGEFNVGAQVLVIPKGLPFRWPDIVARNYVDEAVYGKLKKLRLLPSEVCDDTSFIRRASLDITGRLPTPDEIASFIEDKDPASREHLVDRLLERKEFAELWVMKWAELLEIRSSDNRVYPKATLLYFEWMRDQMLANVPLDRIVQSLLTASESNFRNPPANYYQIEPDTLKLAENTAQVFMGMRIQCAQCHNHPFDRWTMNDYYSFAAFFAQVGRKPGDDPRETVIFDRHDGEVKHLVTGAAMRPKFLGGDVPEIKDQTRREVLAHWLTSQENPYFARNLANIVWAHFLGRGIIEPADDVRISNPPSNPELLDALAKKFTDYKYDFKKLVRDICNSRTYQLSTRPNESNASDNRNFSKAAIRRIRAEVLLDCISEVTETQDKFPGLPRGAHAVEIADGNTATYFLTTFGRASRTTVCSCEVKTDPNLSQALHLLNGDTLQNKIEQGGVVKKLLKQGETPDKVIENLYLRCLGRKPADEESAKLKAFLTDDAKPEQVLNDAFWALLNAKEFVFNH